MKNLPSDEWIARCAQRIVEIEQDMADDEARRIAQDLGHFERTAAMEPEAAVDFVSATLGRPDHRFERRASPRA
jgi:hypothetical protein